MILRLVLQRRISCDADEELKITDLSPSLSECKWVFYSIAAFPIVPFTSFISWDVCTWRREAIQFGIQRWLLRVSSRRIISIHPLLLCIPPKSLFGIRQWIPLSSAAAAAAGGGSVIDSRRAALCFLSGRRGRRGIQHGSHCGEGHVPQRSVTLQISPPPQPQPQSPFFSSAAAWNGLRQIWFSSSRPPVPGERKQILL